MIKMIQEQCGTRVKLSLKQICRIHKTWYHDPSCYESARLSNFRQRLPLPHVMDRSVLAMDVPTSNWVLYFHIYSPLHN